MLKAEGLKLACYLKTLSRALFMFISILDQGAAALKKGLGELLMGKLILAAGVGDEVESREQTRSL